MLLINLTNIIYTLKNFRAFVLHIPSNKSNIALLANNTIAFTLTKKEIKNNNTLKNRKYNNMLFSYSDLMYIDDIYQHFNRQYPRIQNLKVSYLTLFEKLIKISSTTNLDSKLSSILLTRKKNYFQIRTFGLLGKISLFLVFKNFANLWNKKNILSYKDFVTLMFNWLHKLLIIHINKTFIKIIFSKKNIKVRTKTNKVYIKKNTLQKATVIFSNENIIF